MSFLRSGAAALVGATATAGALLIGPLAADSSPAPTTPAKPANTCQAGGQFGDPFARTDLYFGLSREDGPPVTDQQFDAFVDAVVTPRFPDGLTLFQAKGQFKNASGTIVEEGSRVIVLFYAADDPAAKVGVEQIRSKYKSRFHQESVLRVDDKSCVAF
jgi:Protein of unknown function (DUF3574)